MTKLMDMEFIYITMGKDMKVNGWKINNTEKELKLGQMVRSTEASTTKERKKVMGISYRVINQFTEESLEIITFMVKELMYGNVSAPS